MNRFKSHIQILVCIWLIGCNSVNEQQAYILNDADKKAIELFSEKFIHSINDFDFEVIYKSWNNDLFKRRVYSNITKTQKSVFDHYFEKQIKAIIKTGNLDILHRVRANGGKVHLMRVDHFESFSEILILRTFDGYFDLFKYRAEIANKAPVLTDFFSLTENLWYSQSIVLILRQASKYDAFSEERHEMNAAIKRSDKFLNDGDTLAALQSLYEIPDSHSEGNWLSIRKIELAKSLHDTILAAVITGELDHNQNLYIRYLYHYFFQDSTDLKKIHHLLSEEVGESPLYDSLIREGSFWGTP